MKSISDSVIELIIVIIIIIFVIIVFFNVLKGLSYAGRPEAKFGYALAGSISFTINPVAQGISDAATIANDVLLGVVVAATVVGIVSGIKANYDENVQFLADYGIDQEDVGLGNLLFKDLDEGGAPIDEIVSRVGNAYKKVFTNPLGAGLLFGTLGLDALSYALNNMAHAIQDPILYYLVPEGVVAVNLSNIGNAQVNEMLNDLNQSYANYIEQQGYCSDPTSSECQNLYATYLIAKYLFYTYGETLGQSVTIAGNHNEYALLLFDYNSAYSVTLNDVLCMLDMMEYYNQVPLEVMYGGDSVIASGGQNIACQVLINYNGGNYNFLSSLEGQDTNLYNKLLVNSYEVDQNGNVDENWSTSNNFRPNQVIIIPGSIPLPNGILIQYTYEGGNRVILITSIVGES